MYPGVGSNGLHPIVRSKKLYRTGKSLYRNGWSWAYLPGRIHALWHDAVESLYYQVKRSFDEVALVLDEDETSYNIHYVGDSLPAGARVDIIRHALSGTNDNTHHLILQSPLGSRPMVITKKSIFNEPSRDAGNTCLLARLLVPGKKPSTFIFFLDDPKNLSLSAARISFEFHEKKVKVIADKPAYGIYLDVPDGVNLEDNYFHLVPGEVKWIAYHSLIPAATLQKSTSIKTLADIIHHEKKLD